MAFTVNSDCGTLVYHFVWRHDVPVYLRTERVEQSVEEAA